MINFYLVLGDIDSRKSHTIRALTGAFNSGVYDIATEYSSKEKMFVQVRSLQEDNISSDEHLDNVIDNNCSSTLVAMRIKKGRIRLGALDYIEEFLSTDCIIRRIAVLGTDKLPYSLPEELPLPCFIPNVKEMASNHIASMIRNWWKWL